MRTFLRWWETLGRPERIVAMSLTAGSVVAIANSTTWAVAVCYMTRQKALVAMRAPLATPGEEAAESSTRDYPRAAADTSATETGRVKLGQ
jgi:hypothetical protein